MQALKERVDSMTKVWSEHKKACVQASNDLLCGKKELFSKCGVYIDQNELKRIHEEK